MLYNQTKTQSGAFMPLLMGCTAPSPVETEEQITIIYDPVSQKPLMDMRTVGTRSLKVSVTRYKPAGHTGFSCKSDRKNEIDDSKSVK